MNKNTRSTSKGNESSTNVPSGQEDPVRTDLSEIRDLLVRLDNRMDGFEKRLESLEGKSGESHPSETSRPVKQEEPDAAQSQDPQAWPIIPINVPKPGQQGVIVGQMEMFDGKLSTLDNLTVVIRHIKDFRVFKQARPACQQTLISTFSAQVRIFLGLHLNTGIILDSETINAMKSYYATLTPSLFDLLSVIHRVHLKAPRVNEYAFIPLCLSVFKYCQLYLAEVDEIASIMHDLVGGNLYTNKKTIGYDRKYTTIWEIVYGKLREFNEAWYECIVQDIDPVKYLDWPSLSFAMQNILKRNIRIMKENLLLFRGSIQAYEANKSTVKAANKPTLAKVNLNTAEEYISCDTNKPVEVNRNLSTEHRDLDTDERTVDSDADHDEDASSEDGIWAVAESEKRSRPCFKFMQGDCNLGDSCEYSHDKNVCDEYIRKLSKYK